jgi:hypothetical protein
MKSSIARILFSEKVALILIGGFMWSGSSIASSQQRRILKGQWGGPHLSMSVGESVATVEYDCAHGQIDGPLLVDENGRFDLNGTLWREHGGPSRINEEPESEPARYTGWTDGSRMTLTVMLVDKKESAGKFELAVGSAGKLFKCRCPDY